MFRRGIRFRADGLDRGIHSSLILASQSCEAPRGVFLNFTSCEIQDTSRYG